MVAQRVVVEIAIDEGEPLGAKPNDRLMITHIQAGTVAEGKLKQGDMIVELNDQKVRDPDHFFRLLRRAAPVARLVVMRDPQKQAEFERTDIPADRQHLVPKREGFSYSLMTIKWTEDGPRLGLGIKDFMNRVLVSRTEDRSLAAAQLKVGDHLIDIDGTPVTDQNVAKQLLLNALQTSGVVTSIVERPESLEAKAWTNRALTASAQPPSVQMASDVQDIAAKQKEKMRTAPAADTKGILRQAAPAPNAAPNAAAANAAPRRLSFTEGHQEMPIRSDNDGKQLRPVKK